MATVKKSYFCTYNNPAEKLGVEDDPEIVLDEVERLWMEGHPERSFAASFCESAAGLRHLHAMFESAKNMRPTAVKKVMPGIHVEPTFGNKAESLDYLLKRGKYEEKGEKVLAFRQVGDIKASQGNRTDFDIIEQMIKAGSTPADIFEFSFAFRRYEKMVRDAYFAKRKAETPVHREIETHFSVGNSGTGKTYQYVKLVEAYGDDHVFFLNEHQHGMDKYNGEEILFIDELRDQWKYPTLLSILDNYRGQIKCRYGNAIALYTKIYITSVLPIEEIFRLSVQNVSEHESFQQFKRRIDFMHYHYKLDGEYRMHTIPMSEYIDYYHLKAPVTKEDLSLDEEARRRKAMEAEAEQQMAFATAEPPMIDEESR